MPENMSYADARNLIEGHLNKDKTDDDAWMWVKDLFDLAHDLKALPVFLDHKRRKLQSHAVAVFHRAAHPMDQTEQLLNRF